MIRSLPPEPRTEVQKTSDLVNAHRLAGAQQFEAWLASERARVKVEINQAQTMIDDPKCGFNSREANN